ncbi:MAG TPA: hypothetical protein VGO93_22945 [Candidatus Xenobia bacterium]|jgi:hypothetical protein
MVALDYVMHAPPAYVVPANAITSGCSANLTVKPAKKKPSARIITKDELAISLQKINKVHGKTLKRLAE